MLSSLAQVLRSVSSSQSLRLVRINNFFESKNKKFKFTWLLCYNSNTRDRLGVINLLTVKNWWIISRLWHRHGLRINTLWRLLTEVRMIGVGRRSTHVTFSLKAESKLNFRPHFFTFFSKDFFYHHRLKSIMIK